MKDHTKLKKLVRSITGNAIFSMFCPNKDVKLTLTFEYRPTINTKDANEEGKKLAAFFWVYMPWSTSHTLKKWLLKFDHMSLEDQHELSKEVRKWREELGG